MLQAFLHPLCSTPFTMSSRALFRLMTSEDPWEWVWHTKPVDASLKLLRDFHHYFGTHCAKSTGVRPRTSFCIEMSTIRSPDSVHCRSSFNYIQSKATRCSSSICTNIISLRQRKSRVCYPCSCVNVIEPHEVRCQLSDSQRLDRS